MPFVDPFYREYADALADPANDIFLIVPSDSNDLVKGIKALRVYNSTGADATVNVVTVAGTTISLPVPQGLWTEPLRIRKVLATGTSNGLVLHGYTATPITGSTV